MTDAHLQTLLEALVRQSLLLAVVATMLLLLRRPLTRHVGPGLAYAAWLALPVLLIVGLLSASQPAITLSTDLVRQFGPALAQTPSLKLPASPSLTAVWLTLWATGALAFVARMAWLQRRASTAMTRAKDGSHWIGAHGPALIGLWPARLVLPPDFEQRFDAAQRPLVLAHEAVHRSRFDNHWNALAAALCALHWFNPLAWLALRAMRADQELSCDHAVMRRHPGRAADYGRALLSAQTASSSLQPWSCWGSSHPLIERVSMLALHPHTRSRRLLGAGALAVLTLGAAAAVAAVNTAAVVPPELAKDPIGLDLDVELTHMDGDTSTGKRASKARLVVEAGQQALVVIGGQPDQPAPDQVRVEITPRRADAARVLLDVRVTEGGQPLLKSAVLVQQGADATLFSAPDEPQRTEVRLRVRTIAAAEIPALKRAR